MNTGNDRSESIVTTVRLMATVVACAALAAVPSASIAQDWGSATPGITVSVNTVNGWVVAQGTTLGGSSNTVAWSAPLVRAGVSYTVQHGLGTTYVTAGKREFLIDNITGKTTELRNGKVYNRPQSATPPAPSAATQPAAQDSLLPSQDDPEQVALANYQDTLEATLAKTRQLMTAHKHLEKVQAQIASGHAPPEALEVATAQVARAQREVAAARNLADHHAKEALAVKSPATMPHQGDLDLSRLTPQQRDAIQHAEEIVLVQTENVDQVSLQLQKLQSANGDPGEIKALQSKLVAYNQALAKAQRELSRLRAEASVADLGKISPDMRSRIGQAQRELVSAREQVALLEQALALAQSGNQGRGAGGNEQVQRLITRLASAMQRQDSARQELTDLMQAASKE